MAAVLITAEFRDGMRRIQIQPSIDPRRVRELASSGYIEGGDNVPWLGRPMSAAITRSWHRDSRRPRRGTEHSLNVSVRCREEILFRHAITEVLDHLLDTARPVIRARPCARATVACQKTSAGAKIVCRAGIDNESQL